MKRRRTFLKMSPDKRGVTVAWTSKEDTITTRALSDLIMIFEEHIVYILYYMASNSSLYRRWLRKCQGNDCSGSRTSLERLCKQCISWLPKVGFCFSYRSRRSGEDGVLTAGWKFISEYDSYKTWHLSWSLGIYNRTASTGSSGMFTIRYILKYPDRSWRKCPMLTPCSWGYDYKIYPHTQVNKIDLPIDYNI